MITFTRRTNPKNMQHKILIVEDDQHISEILEINLSNEGFEVDCAFSAEEAIEKLDDSFHLILLDIMMGGMSGYKMAGKLRSENNHIPIIFLTAKNTENDMLTGFSVGGDDYISKPFSIKEVVARIQALLKRNKAISSALNEESKLNFDDLKINTELKEVWISEDKIELTKTEFEIFSLLAENPTRIFSRPEIIDAVWGSSAYITERTVDVHITRLRKKLREYAYTITSRSGYGYRFNVSEE